LPFAGVSTAAEGSGVVVLKVSTAATKS